MGFFDRLLGRNKVIESDSNVQDNNLEGTNVPFKIFQKFQEDTRQGMQSLREEFTKLVEENHGLKKQIISISDRLDEIQREQLKQGMENKKGLDNVKNSIAAMGGKVNPVMQSSDPLNEIPISQLEKINSAKNELIKSIKTGDIPTKTSDMRMFNRPSGLEESSVEGSKRKPG